MNSDLSCPAFWVRGWILPVDQPSLNFSDFLTLSTLLACTEAYDNIIMHCVKKYLLSPPNLTPNNFSVCPVSFVWCDTVNSHYLVTSSTPFIVCSLTHLSFSYLEPPHPFGFLLYRNCCLRSSSLLSSLLSNFYLPWGERTRLHTETYPAWTGFCQNKPWE